MHDLIPRRSYVEHCRYCLEAWKMMDSSPFPHSLCMSEDTLAAVLDVRIRKYSLVDAGPLIWWEIQFAWQIKSMMKMYNVVQVRHLDIVFDARLFNMFVTKHLTLLLLSLYTDPANLSHFWKHPKWFKELKWYWFALFSSTCDRCSPLFSQCKLPNQGC